MSIDYYDDPENLNIKKKSAGKIEKGLKRLLIIAVVIFFAQMIWLFGVSPFIPFSTIEVNGFLELNRAEVLHLAGINENSSYFSVNTKEIQNKLSSHILVESAVVVRRFPDRLTMYLNPRQPAAVTITNIDSGQAPLYIDRNGVFYKIGCAYSYEGMNLPVLSGIENPQLNMRLPNSLVSLVDNLSGMAVSSPDLLSAVSEIRIERKAWDGFDLVIFPVHSSIRVRVEDNITENTLRYILLMLNVFEGSNNKPYEIDFRSGMGSYKIKEQSL
ncbi:MAG: FtsQ-type POTRA domain-containing protein [Treponema sp.]|nr:FtsQ-type POTRA domain-containing protein [Treponema sp.]